MMPTEAGGQTRHNINAPFISRIYIVPEMIDQILT